MTWLAFVVIILASFRITRLFTRDTLTVAFRERLYDFAWDDTDPDVQTTDDGRVFVPTARAPWRTYVYELFTCSWCLGVWISALVYSAWRWWDTEPVHVVIVVAAVAGAQGFIASRSEL